MTDGGAMHSPVEPPASADSAGGHLVVAPWGVGSALSLVAVAFVLTLLAGAVVAGTSAVGSRTLAPTLVGGGVLLGLYLALLAIVWGASVNAGVRFTDAVGLRSSTGLRWYAAALGAAVLGWLFSAVFMAGLTALGVEVPREDLAVFRLLPSGSLGVAIVVLLLVFVAPFAEEVIYRGVLLSALSNRWGTAAGLAVSSAVFSAAHLSLFGLVPLLVAGGLFGWLFIRSRSLRVAIVAHVAYNAFGVIALFASKASGIW